MAAERIPRFQAERERLEQERVQRIEEERLKLERARQDTEIKGWMAQAERALEAGRDAEVIAICQQVLAIRPDHTDALANSRICAAAERTARAGARPLPEIVRVAAGQYGRGRSGCATFSFAAMQSASRAWRPRRPAPPGACRESPDRLQPISWSSFAGEFLKEHAQELLLCLAVLLIVVSSTVGAHLLLGDLLWSPVGKCTLAMVATLLFAAFGASLLKWGATCAGRMMLVATLIVVPIHFMLVGEMKLLHDPSAFRLAFLAIEGLGAGRPGALGERHACVTGRRAVSDDRASAPFRRQCHHRAGLAAGVGAAVRVVSTVASGVPGGGVGAGSPAVGRDEQGSPRVRLHDARAARVCPGGVPGAHGGLRTSPRTRRFTLCPSC